MDRYFPRASTSCALTDGCSYRSCNALFRVLGDYCMQPVCANMVISCPFRCIPTSSTKSLSCVEAAPWVDGKCCKPVEISFSVPSLSINDFSASSSSLFVSPSLRFSPALLTNKKSALTCLYCEHIVAIEVAPSALPR